MSEAKGEVRTSRDVLLCPRAIGDDADANGAGEHEHFALPPSAGGLITARHARARLIEDGPHATTTDLRLPRRGEGGGAPRRLPDGGGGNRVEEEEEGDNGWKVQLVGNSLSRRRHLATPLLGWRPIESRLTTREAAAGRKEGRKWVQQQARTAGRSLHPSLAA